MGRKIRRQIRRILVSLTGLICGTTCAFFVMAEEPLKNLIIQDGVTEIAKYEYCDKTALESVYIPGSVNIIGMSAFEGCDSLVNLQLQEGISNIDNRTFALCRNLSQVAIPNSTARIGNAAFYGCSSLREVILPSNLNAIDNNLFYQCSSLSNIIIPESVVSIGQQSFYNCSGLTNLNLPNNLTSIGEGAFYNCTGLMNINIPDSVNYIGNDAFTGCSQLTISCNPGSYAEQFAKANGFAVNNGQAELIIAEIAESEQGMPEQININNQSVIIPKTGVERPYVLCIMALMCAAAILFIMNRKDNHSFE